MMDCGVNTYDFFSYTDGGTKKQDSLSVYLNNPPFGIQAKYSYPGKKLDASFSKIDDKLALFPEIIVVRLQGDFRAKHFFGEPLQQHARDKSVQIAFVSDDNVGPGQVSHCAVTLEE